ncbi:hypothetical protein BY996DRAFT_6693663 [Phakopsora pachyrhizi]|nr:hypothetical protein BY996DRAFT_6693663 [Phakopsora pachyrhizi]
MYFILKQAHASEGHGGRDKTAKAVKKTHSFIRKGLICLFLEICPTCRARNDAAKKDKITNIQASHVGVSPSGFEEQSLSFATWAHPQSQSSLRHTPYPDHRNSFYLGELAQVPSNQDPGSCLRRTPTRTDAGFLIHPQLSPGHSRCHTYPSMEGNNFSAPHNRPESPSRVNEASFSNAFRTLNQPVEFIMGAPPSNFGLPVNSFLAGQQVGFPEVLNAESLQGQEMVNTLYNSQIPQQTANITSNNIFDSINRDFLINQSGIRDEKSISFQTATYEPQSVPEFDIFQPVIMENLGMEHNIEDLISSTEIGNQIVDSAPYVYNHQPKTKDTSSPDASTSSLPSDTTQRMIVNKNHKQLSLLAPTLLNTSQNTILDREFSAFSGPSSSTSGVFWKADGDSNTPLLTAGLSSAVSTVSHNSQGYSDGSSGLSYPH